MKAVRRVDRQVAPTESTVLILGGTGTGKSWSPGRSTIRPLAAMPFVAINCARCRRT